jgi:hypothetical protein
MGIAFRTDVRYYWNSPQPLAFLSQLERETYLVTRNNAMNNPLTPDEVALFRALIKSGVILLLMLRLARPTGARELADILGLEEHTTARYLRHLARMNIVARSGYRGGYVVLEGRQLIFGGGRTVENLQSCGPIIITRDTDFKNESLVIIDSARTVEKLQFDEDLSPVEQALKEAGISNPKRQELASLPGVTPESIRAWEANLKHEKARSTSRDC